MEKQKTLRTGLVGCGGHGNALAQAIVRSETLCLVACADPDTAAASRAAAFASDVSTHDSVEALIAECDADAIVVATPHHLLSPVTLTALQALPLRESCQQRDRPSHRPDERGQNPFRQPIPRGCTGRAFPFRSNSFQVVSPRLTARRERP